MVIGSHNSWSYLNPRKWWMHLIMFTARCQNVDIRTQYIKYNVRCFDLRIRFDDDDNIVLAHGKVEYKYANESLMADLNWLDSKGDCYVRVLHEVRSKKDYTQKSIQRFNEICSSLEFVYTHIKFWCGRNLYNWNFDYDFGEEPTCEGNYASVKTPKVVDDWFPWLYARRKNKEILKNGTRSEILLIDYVNVK